MQTAQRVNDFITSNWPSSLCDACIVRGTGLRYQAHATQITITLGTTSDFVRDKGICSICGEERKVIASVANPDADIAKSRRAKSA